MKRLLSLVAFFATLHASAQQVNPVPDYVFANRMSAGRNTVTDTAAYLSIGPRYGATRGVMPPMVVDTASFSGNKRNGLLIFSVQKNKFLYWDSVGVKWAEMSGTGGSAITGSGVSGYMPEFTTTTNLDTTRLYHSAGRFAIGSTTTTNGVFNVYGGQSYFDTSLKVGSQTFLADEGNNEVYINTTTDNGDYKLQVSGNIYNTGSAVLAATSGNVGIGTTSPAEKLDVTSAYTRIVVTSTTNSNNSALYFNAKNSGGTNVQGGVYFIPAATPYLSLSGDNSVTHLNVTSAGLVGIGITTPAVLTHISSGYIAPTGGFDANVRLAITNSGSNDRFAGVSINSGSIGGSFINFGDTDDENVGSIAYFNSDNHMRFTVNAAERGRINSAGEWIIDASGTDAGDYKLQVVGNTLLNGNLRTAAPSGGTANDWRLGTVATVSPTSPNRTIEVSIGGTIYYIAAKTTND